MHTNNELAPTNLNDTGRCGGLSGFGVCSQMIEDFHRRFPHDTLADELIAILEKHVSACGGFV